MLSKRIKRTVRDKVNALASLYLRQRASAVQDSMTKYVVAGSRQQLFFITGFDKSGTTWLQKMFNTHPQLFCQGSGQFFNFFEENMHFLNALGGYRTIIESISSTDWYKNSGHNWLHSTALEGSAQMLIRRSMESFAISKGVKAVGDKSVCQDCFLIRRIFPDVPIVAIVRDGRDVSVSFAHQFRRKGKPGKFADSQSTKLDPRYLEAVARAWAHYNEHLHKFKMSDQHFILVTYEDLLEECEAIMREVFDHVGVSRDLDVVRDVVKRNGFTELSGGRNRGQEDNRSFFRKGIAGDWVNYYTSEDRAIFESVAGATLRLYGYELS